MTSCSTVLKAVEKWMIADSGTLVGSPAVKMTTGDSDDWNWRRAECIRRQCSTKPCSNALCAMMQTGGCDKLAVNKDIYSRSNGLLYCT